MYEAVHARPDGDATVSRMASTAAAYGYDGIVVRNHGDAKTPFDADGVAEEFGVDVVDGVEVKATDRSTASGYLGSYRPTTTVLLIHGGDPAMNRFAVEQEQVDVLAHPMRGAGDLNHVLARKAAKNDVRLEVDLSCVLRRDGGQRVRAIADLQKLHELIQQYDVPYVVSADPTSHLHVRAPRDLRAVGEAIGFEGEEIDAGLEEWKHLGHRNRDRVSESYVSPGVRAGRHETQRTEHHAGDGGEEE